MASSWLTAFPTSPELTLADDDFCLAVKNRLGLPCADDLPSTCICGSNLLTNPQHFLSCHLLKRTAMTARHDMIVRKLADFFRTIGAVVHIEPRIVGFERFRPDLDIILSDRSLLVDVGVTHAAAPSRHSVTKLAAASSAEATKASKYAVLAAARAASFLPFIMESYGAYGKKALEVLHILRKAAANAVLPIPTSSSQSSFPQILAVTLQRGNALVFKRGAVDAKAAAAGRPVFRRGAAAAADSDDEDGAV